MIKQFLLCIALLSIISGCSTCKYNLGNETFSTAHEALQKQTQMQAQVLSEITSIDNPIHGTALILIPSDVEIKKNYIRISGNASLISNEQIDYLIAVNRNNFQFISDTILKRCVFDRGTVEKHNGNPASLPIGNSDYLIFADLDGWFLKGKEIVKTLQLSLDLTKPIVAFPDSIYEQVKALKNT